MNLLKKEITKDFIMNLSPCKLFNDDLILKFREVTGIKNRSPTLEEILKESLEGRVIDTLESLWLISKIVDISDFTDKLHAYFVQYEQLHHYSENIMDDLLYESIDFLEEEQGPNHLNNLYSLYLDPLSSDEQKSLISAILVGTIELKEETNGN